MPGGELNLDIPRDCLSSFEPKLAAKHQRRMPGFDDHVISMYARSMSVREIQAHLLELYGTDVSPDLISTITDEVLKRSRSGNSGRSKRCTQSSTSTPCA
jgi:putative transposase